VCACHPSYGGGRCRRVGFSRLAREKAGTLSKKQTKAKGPGCGLSDGELSKHRGPAFRP
jgi:hypothetical protein